VRLGNVVEGEDAPAKAEEEHGSKGNKGPEGEDRDDLFLDQSGERDQFEEQGEVEGRDEEGKGDGLLSARHGGRRGLGRFCLAAQIDRWTRIAGTARSGFDVRSDERKRKKGDVGCGWLLGGLA
jgi:hypothetical protein